jgi:hypothetical protein
LQLEFSVLSNVLVSFEYLPGVQSVHTESESAAFVVPGVHVIFISLVGANVGIPLGIPDGSALGAADGCALGAADGCALGCDDGLELGSDDGIDDGTLVGDPVGVSVE